MRDCEPCGQTAALSRVVADAVSAATREALSQNCDADTDQPPHAHARPPAQRQAARSGTARGGHVRPGARMKIRASRVVASAAAIAAVCAVRRVGHRSGATSGELRAVLPGDEIVKSPMWESTRAITIDASAGDVWPWIVQMGYPRFRAGWYTPHWLDRLQWGIREGSAERIRPDLQHLEVGDRIPDSPDWSVFFTVEHVEPRRALVLHSTRHLIKPIHAIDFSWAFVLDSAAADQTRLIMRARASCQPRAAWLALGALIGMGDFVNASVMLHGIKRRCERPARGAGARNAAFAGMHVQS
jgi:hypothetical protein